MAAAGVVGVIGVIMAALPHSGTFNIHPAPYRVLTHSGSSSFGHQVLRIGGDRLLVGAPAGPGGRLFQCRVGPGECGELEMDANVTNTNLGMALTRRGRDVIACGPGWSRRCNRNVQSSGICVLIGQELRPIRSLRPGYQGCQRGLVDLVFLFDGSSSMSPAQFGAIRDFMVDVMGKLENSSIRFAAVQFSSHIQPCFSLADFAARPRPRELLMGLKQLGGLTDTFTAIKYVVHQTFSEAAGSRPGARRVLIIITDGDATDSDTGGVRDAEQRDIIRYVIGIGNNFNSPDTRLYLGQFASRPSAEFVKILGGFEKLRGLFQEIQHKIYDIEGTSDVNRFHLELSNSGMSVGVVNGRLLTGAVGADNWAGGLVHMDHDYGAHGAYGAYGANGAHGAYGAYGAYGAHGSNGTNGAYGAYGSNGSNGAYGAYGDNGSNGAHGADGSNGSNGAYGAYGDNGAYGAYGDNEDNGDNETFVPNPENATAAYLGYSVASLFVPPRTLVAAGAPRHRHVGAVVLFDVPNVPKANGTWRVLQTLIGEQVGSYFGASLSALEQGGVTVALLVGVPNYYDGRRGGRVGVYRWREDSLELTTELGGSPGHPLGRFGASLGTLGDMDGDGHPEVAVGAPGEDGDAGAVYVFQGCPGGVTPTHSQRLEGRSVWPGLRLFGTALDGTGDLTGDGTTDIAVGTWGHVVVLRSRPVLHVTPSVTFDPALVPSSLVDCSGGTGVTVNVSVCGSAHLSPAPPGDHVIPLDFLLEAEPQRARGRGLLGAGRERGVAGRLLLGAGPTCTHLPMELPPCLDDPVTPVQLRLQLIGPEGAPPTPALPPGTRPLWAQVALERSCGADGECRADLWVRVALSPPALQGAPWGGLRLRLLVANGGHDAYGTRIQVTLPGGMGMRRARAERASSPVPISCRDAVGQPWGLSCNLSRPVLRAGWEVTVELTFALPPSGSWGESMGLKALVSSDNEPPETLGDNEVSWAVPVHYALQVAATWDDGSTPYINFTTHGPRNKSLEHRYRIEILQAPPPGAPAPQVTAFVLLPHTLPHGISVHDPQVRVEPGGGACAAVGQKDEGAVGQELRTRLGEGCSAPQLRLFRCPPAPPPNRVLIGANLEAPPTDPGSAHARFCSALSLSLAPPQLVAPPPGLRAQGVTSLELIPQFRRWAGLLGGGAGGLLLLLLIGCGLRKCGFFRRNFRERLEGGEGPEVDGEEGPEVDGEGPEVGGENPEVACPEGDGETAEVEGPEVEGDGPEVEGETPS